MDRKIRKRAETVLIVCFLAVMSLMISSLREKDTGKAADTAEYLSENWYYIENGRKVEVDLPISLKKEDGEDLVLYNEGLTSEASERTVSTKGAAYKLSAVLDDQVIYVYEDSLFPRNDQMANRLNCIWTLPARPEGKTLALTYRNVDNGRFEINDILIGRSSDIMEHHLAESAALLINVFLMLVMAAVAVLAFVYLRHIHMTDMRFLDVAAFLVICGIWCATDSSLMQNLTGLSPVTNYISFYAFMMMAVPMLHFIQRTGEMAAYRVLDVLIFAAYLNAIGQTLVNYFFGVPMIQMLFLTHIQLFASVSVSIGLLIKEYREKKEHQLYSILRALFVLGASGLFAILLYWALEITYYDYIYELGILIFIYMLLFQIVSNMAQSMKFKMEMLIYRRLAKEDRLTGLANRLSFDEYMKEIENMEDGCRNAVLIFMDINGLKRVNDRYGHNAGDELLVSASQIIRRTFGEIGRCFRLGGDEFCVIIPCSGNSGEDFFAVFDSEIEKYNKTGKYYLEIARGSCWRRKEDGSLLSISDWKYEADQRMYEDKSRRHELARKDGRE